MHPCSYSLLVFCCLPPQSALWSGMEQGALWTRTQEPMRDCHVITLRTLSTGGEDWEELAGAGRGRPLMTSSRPPAPTAVPVFFLTVGVREAGG